MLGRRLARAIPVFALLGLALPLRAATRNVTSIADTGANTLRAAVAAAGDGDTITFDASIAGQTIVLTSGEIDINASISMTGGVKISGNSASRIFKIAALKTVSIQALTFQDGFHQGADGAAGAFGGLGFGGAIWNQGTLHLLSCHFTNNHAQGGNGGPGSGGPPGDGGAAFGGAIFNDATGALDITTCDFDGNGAQGGTGGQASPGPGGTGGLADGGAIKGASLLLSISGSTFESNTAHGGSGGSSGGDGGRGEGGAISTIDQQFSLSDSTLLKNTAHGGDGHTVSLSTGGRGGDGQGGALFVASDTAPTVDRSTFDQNQASSGGGFDISHVGRTFGGGIDLVGDLTIRTSTISNNSAALGSEGGGIHAFGTLDMTNCTLTGNSVTEGSGGGLSASDSATTLTNITISGNTAAGSAGGIHVTGTGSTTIVNSVVAKNTSTVFNPDGEIENQSVVSGGHNVIGIGFGTIAGSFTPSAGDQIGTVITPLDPGLDPLANNGGPTLTMALELTSPALDRGDDASCPATDQTTATTRPQGAHCDVGAYELPAVTGGGAGGNAFTLTVNVIGAGSVTSAPSAGIACPSDCSNAYFGGTAITLAETPAGGSNFLGWSGACTGLSPTAPLVVNSDLTCTAAFAGAAAVPAAGPVALAGLAVLLGIAGWAAAKRM